MFAVWTRHVSAVSCLRLRYADREVWSVSGTHLALFFRDWRLGTVRRLVACACPLPPVSTTSSRAHYRTLPSLQRFRACTDAPSRQYSARPLHPRPSPERHPGIRAELPPCWHNRTSTLLTLSLPSLRQLAAAIDAEQQSAHGVPTNLSDEEERPEAAGAVGLAQSHTLRVHRVPRVAPCHAPARTAPATAPKPSVTTRLELGRG